MLEFVDNAPQEVGLVQRDVAHADPPGAVVVRLRGRVSAIRAEEAPIAVLANCTTTAAVYLPGCSDSEVEPDSGKGQRVAHVAEGHGVAELAGEIGARLQAGAVGEAQPLDPQAPQDAAGLPELLCGSEA